MYYMYNIWSNFRMRSIVYNNVNNAEKSAKGKPRADTLCILILLIMR